MMSATPVRMAWPLRAWLAVEVLFGIAAVSAIGVAPQNSADNFAWPIKPVVMAALLGGFYMVSAPVFLLPLFARRWENVRVMTLPVALFSTVQLLTTIIHWKLFTVDSGPFYVWFASYVLPPPIFVVAYIHHQRKTRADSAASLAVQPLPRLVRTTFQVLGAALTTGAVAVFISPRLLIPLFPWLLKPLTARSMCGWFLMLGALMLLMARENDRTRCRLGSPMLVFLLPALLIQMLRFHGQVDWSNATLWIGLVVLSVTGACGVYLAMGSWREALR